jgi:uncharacterized protein
MMIVKTSLRELKGKGIGLVSEEFVKKGKKVWTFNPVIDIIVNKKDIPKEAIEFYDTYAISEGNKFVLNTDNARFINHSKNPNIKSKGTFKESFAIKNIKPGEEITTDYEELEDSPINFKVIK